MRIGDSRRSDNVVDRRGLRVGRTGAGIGLGTVLILVVGYFLGVDPSTLIGVVENGAPPAAQNATGAVPADAPPDPRLDFVRAVLGETEDAWSAIFGATNQKYPAPKLVVFEGQVQSACGLSSAAAGPFYCPGDYQLYLDMSFFSELEQRFGAPGDFARAYVIAHEVGHHIQTITGATERLHDRRSRMRTDIGNRLLVEFELQADCYAGIWAYHASRVRQILEPGDLEEALGAASAVGDDVLQKRSQGYVVPDAFTHGTAAQRMQWFKAGFDSGSVDRCDTAGAAAS